MWGGEVGYRPQHTNAVGHLYPIRSDPSDRAGVTESLQQLLAELAAGHPEISVEGALPIRVRDADKSEDPADGSTEDGSYTDQAAPSAQSKPRPGCPV